MTRNELAFLYRHAYEYVLIETRERPHTAAHYAEWYMREHGHEVELPLISHVDEFPRFLRLRELGQA